MKVRLYKKIVAAVVPSAPSTSRAVATGKIVAVSTPVPKAPVYQVVVWVDGVGMVQPAGFERVLDLHEILDRAISLVSDGDYKTIRDCAKQVVEEVGYNNLSPTEKELVSQHNIGTPAQIVKAIPLVSDRKFFSEQYNDRLEDIRAARARKMKSDTFAACKHLEVRIPLGGENYLPLNAPEYIYSKLIIDSPNFGEMAGNLYDLFVSAGLQGQIAGDKSTGLEDFLVENPNTRFSDTIDGGIVSDTNLINCVNTVDELQPNVPDGYDSWADFRDYLLIGIRFGLWA